MAYSFFLNKSRATPIVLSPLAVVISLAAPTIVGAAVAELPCVVDVLDTYGTVASANAYFDARLHEDAWTDAPAVDRPKALWAATLIIDALNYKGVKSTVYTLLEGDPSASEEEIREAEKSQSREFPRGEDTEVPEAIYMACYDIAYALLDGRDPDLDLENLGISSEGFGAVRTAYTRSQKLIEHIVNCVPSNRAWQRLKPFLRDADIIELSRVD